MILILAEKPSQGVDIANAVGATEKQSGYRMGNGYCVSWCMGHLLRLAEPDHYDPNLKGWKLETLPILPDNMEYLVDKQKQFNVIKKLMSRKDVTSLICATDAGREGEHIFRTVYQAAKCKKPWKRLWISSLTTQAIQDGMEHLQDGHSYDNLAAAASCRDQADWLLGLNYTRLYTKVNNALMHVGRVKTPTLALIVQRQNEIDHFQPEPYFVLSAEIDKGVAVSHRFAQEEQVQMDAFLAQKPDTLRVTSVKTIQKRTAPPRLFNLSTLQQQANDLFGLSAAQTLATLQTLYEQHLCGYPRTESEYITEDMADTVSDLLRLLIAQGIACSVLDLLPNVQRLVKEKAVHDHPALLPTLEVTKERLEELNLTSKRLMLLLVYRLIEACAPEKVTEVTEVTAEVNGISFHAKVETVIDAGWTAYHETLLSALALPPKERSSSAKRLVLQEGDTLSVQTWTKEQKRTQPPKPYTEATLLRAMEHAGRKLEDADLKQAINGKGLGTAATRASIIDSLVKEGYVTRDKKNLIPTDKGKTLIASVLPELCSPALTAEWEFRLGKIERGEEQPEDFMRDLKQSVINTVQAVKAENGGNQHEYHTDN